MADDAERAAKAARAKAMLKKRQQQKAGAGISPSPSPAPGRANHHHHHVVLPEQHHQDASVLFGGGGAAEDKGQGSAAADFGEFGVLSLPPRAAISSPPPPVTSPPPPPQLPSPSPAKTSVDHRHTDAAAASAELRTLVANQQQTISLLVNEKASLAAQLDKVEDLQTKFSESEVSLRLERGKAGSLAVRLREAEERAGASAGRMDEVERREREAHEKSREQEHELDLVRRTAGELRTLLETRQSELKALKEQVEADDRVETLERSLTASQDRMEELEFQLSKVKQAHVSTTHERDSLAQELASVTSREVDLRQRHATLEQELTSAQHELTTLSSSLEDTEHARAHLETQLASNEHALASAQQQLAHASAELASHARQLHAALGDVSSAQRRAEDAEQAQRSLQGENSGLLAQLEEVRPKVVELSNKNADAEERIWEAEKKVRVLETSVAKLEAQVAEGVEAEEEVKAQLASVQNERAREGEKYRVDLREVQEAYAAVVTELEHAKERAAVLEKEHEEQRAVLSAKEREQDHWKSQAESRAAEAAAAMNELSAQRGTEDDAIAIVERAQAEIESLRDQLALREDELARLREDAPSSASSRPPSPAHHERYQSLNQEMLSAVRQQHALDLSTAHSRIRTLETDVFEAQAAAHTFQKRVAALEDEVTQLRTQGLATTRAAGRSTPPPPSFPRSASFHGGSEDSRRHSFSSTRPHTPSSSSLRPRIVARPVYEDNLSAETRHKRKVSLSMLKARIESERAAAQHALLSSSSAAASAVGSPRLSMVRGLSSVAIVEADEGLVGVNGGGETPRRTGSEERRPRSVAAASDVQSRANVMVMAASGGSEVGDGKGGVRASHFLDESHVFWCHSCRGDLVVL